MNIKKLSAAVALLLTMTVGAFSQDDRNPVYIASMNNLTYLPKSHKVGTGAKIGEVTAAVMAGQSTKEMAGYENAVRAAIVKGMSQAFRLHVVDGALSEEEREEPFAIYVDGDISNMTTTSKTETETYEEKGEKKTRTKVYFRGQVGVTLQVKDAHNDGVIASRTFNVAETETSWIETAEGAMNKALEVLSRRVRVFFNDLYPLSGSIIERAGEKNNKQKEVYIDLGAAHGITVGQNLTVLRNKTIAGKSAQEEVARLRVKKVEGDEVSFCKVTSSGKVLKNALDSGEELFVVTN